MKHLKTFNESILDDVRKENDKSLSDIQKKIGVSTGDHKFCPECGIKLDKNDSFCGDCGTEQESDKSIQTFTINGKIEANYPNNQKTPSFTLSSINKTLSGTSIQLDRSINKFDIPIGKEVSIKGTTKNGKAPTFQNPIIVNSIEDIKKIN